MDIVLEMRVWGWGPSSPHKELVNNIFKAISNAAETNGVTYIMSICDVSQYSVNSHNPAVAFGNLALHADDSDNPGPRWMLPDLDNLVSNKKNAKTRQVAAEKIKNIARELRQYAELKQPGPQMHVETKDGTTFGPIGADITITESEAEYLKRLKDLLGGSKMVITKGDIRIEIE